MLLERKHTLEAQSWAQCHEDELCQIMKADYPNEGIAALALEKQYGLDEQQARMIFRFEISIHVWNSQRSGRTRQYGNWTYA